MYLCENTCVHDPSADIRGQLGVSSLLPPRGSQADLRRFGLVASIFICWASSLAQKIYFKIVLHIHSIYLNIMNQNKPLFFLKIFFQAKEMAQWWEHLLGKPGKLSLDGGTHVKSWVCCALLHPRFVESGKRRTTGACQPSSRFSDWPCLEGIRKRLIDPPPLAFMSTPIARVHIKCTFPPKCTGHRAHTCNPSTEEAAVRNCASSSSPAWAT